jgi:hypothetical protein
MDEIAVLQWVKDNLGSYIEDAVKDTMYDLAWIAAITVRETGQLIGARVKSGLSFNLICQTMQGDYTKRKNDAKLMYHGYGFTQIDIASFPAFIGSGDWQKPDKLYPFTIKVLESKRHYIINHFNDLTHEELEHGITSAYNCGEGNVVKAIQNNQDPDQYTTGHNYAKDVMRLRDLFKTKL